jgi:hypothetical protein
MTPAVVDALGRLKERGYLIEDADLVFCNAAGEHLDSWALRRRYYRALQRAGLRRIRFHEYADLFVMPTLRRRPCSARFSVSRRRHNQRASRKARSASGGW